MSLSAMQAPPSFNSHISVGSESKPIGVANGVRICNARLTIRQHLLHTRKIVQTSGVSEFVVNFAKCRADQWKCKDKSST
jgi:hypothetical protein